LVSPVNLFTEALASVGDVDGYAHLNAKLAADQQEQVRDSVVGLLGALNDDGKVVPLLRKALIADPSITVRTTAAASLAHFRDARG
jgi:HEAT repeat protein